MRLVAGICLSFAVLVSACTSAQVGRERSTSRAEPVTSLFRDQVPRPDRLCLPYVDDPENNLRQPPEELVFHPGTYTNDQRCDLRWHALVVNNEGAPSNIYDAEAALAETPFAAVPAPSLVANRPDEHVDYRDCLPDTPIQHSGDANRGYITAILNGLDCYVGELNNTPDSPQQPLRIMIFAHGGMVTREDAIREAENLAPAMMHDGHFPIFLIWNSGLQDAYPNYLTAMNSRGEYDSRQRFLYAPARLFGDLGSGIAQIPENILNQGVRFQDSVLEQDVLRRTSQGESPSSSLRYYLPIECRGEYFTDDLDELAVHIDRQANTKYCMNEAVYRARQRPIYNFVPNDLGGLWGADNQYVGNIIYPLSTENLYDPEAYWEALNGYDEHYAQDTLRFQLMRPTRVLTTSFAEVGRNAWDDMIGRTRSAVRIPPERWSARDQALAARQRAGNDDARTSSDVEDELKAIEDAYADLEPDLDIQGGGFAELIEALNARIDCDADIADGSNRCVYDDRILNTRNPHVEVTFAGHSMGSLIGNEIARFHPDFPMHRVIYMAAAVSVRDMHGSLIPYMQRQGTGDIFSPNVCDADAPFCTVFHNLMLHPQRETREANIAYAVPPGSLLEWIDEMFEDPRSPDGRTLGKWSNIVANRDIFSGELQRRMMFRVFPVQADTQVSDRFGEDAIFGYEAECDPAAVEAEARSAAMNDTLYGHRCHPLLHGEFNDFSFWRDRYLFGRFAYYHTAE